MEVLENRLSEDHDVLQAYRGQPAPKSAGYDITSYFRSAATKYSTKVRKTGVAGAEAHNSVTV